VCVLEKAGLSSDYRANHPEWRRQIKTQMLDRKSHPDHEQPRRDDSAHGSEQGAGKNEPFDTLFHETDYEQPNLYLATDAAVRVVILNSLLPPRSENNLLA
jgi:hypothetical protein